MMVKLLNTQGLWTLEIFLRSETVVFFSAAVKSYENKFFLKEEAIT